jgi:hypothetical protein
MPYVKSIHPSTMGKLLREHFTGEFPISIKTTSEQEQLISRIKAELKKLQAVRLSDSYYVSHDKEREECSLRFALEDDLHRYYRPYCSLTLKFSEDDHCLIIEDSPRRALVYQVEQIYSFINKLKAEFDQKKAQAHKTEKINNLKQQAIIARIKEIAKEDKFEFATTWREYQNKLKVMVRLEGSILLEVDIPYSGFQEALKNLRPLIRNVNELQKLGISFKIKSDSGYSGHGWITPDNE